MKQYGSFKHSDFHSSLSVAAAETEMDDIRQQQMNSLQQIPVWVAIDQKDKLESIKPLKMF